MTESRQDITVPYGATIIFDAANGPLTIGKLINNGTIRLTSSKDGIANFAIDADEVKSHGAIISEVPVFIMKTKDFDGRGGKFIASDRIVLNSGGDLVVRGGTFESEFLDFIIPGALNARADRIDSKVTTIASEVIFGVNSGDLTVVKSEITGDPIWYNRAGDLNITPSPTGGDDLYLVASGNITVGAIDTTGGDATATGRIMLVAGASVTADGSEPPIDNPVLVPCTDCDSIYQELGVGPNSQPTKSVTVNGNVSGQGFSASGQNVTINGNISITNVNSASGAGACSISYLNTVSITGDVTLTGPVINGVTKPFFNCLPTDGFDRTYTQNVTVGGTINANVEIQSIGPGAIALGAIVAEQSVNIYAGLNPSDLPTCGGPSSIVANTAVAPRTTLPISTLTVGNISAAQSFVTLAATGNVSAGSIDLPTYTLGSAHAISKHAVVIFANYGGADTVSVFDAGAGGSNGCGAITNHGIVTGLGGVIAINNPGGVSFETASIQAISDAIATPSIWVDAGTQTLTLDGDLSVDGTGSVRAGFIALSAGTLMVPGAVTISASDTTTNSSLPAPFVAIAASNIPVPGNLTIESNSDQNTNVYIGPTGYIITGGSFPCGYNGSASGAVNFTGSGDISITANSSYGSVNILGTPLTFNAGTVTVKANGGLQGPGSINVNYDGQTAQVPSLVSTGGAVTLNADGTSGLGGNVSVTADAVNITSTFDAHANALASGNGGFVGITTNGGDLTVSSGAGAFNVAAKGFGTDMPGGSAYFTSAAAMSLVGGTVDVSPASGGGGTIVASAVGALTLDGSLIADAVSEGPGGTVVVSVASATFTGSDGKLSATGAGSGNGGTAYLVFNDSTTLDVSAISLIADSGESGGDGGNIGVFYPGAGTLTLGDVSATAQSANGGNISILCTADVDVNIDATGSIDTNAAGELAGSFTISPNNTDNDNIVFNITGSGGFFSVLSATGKSLSVDAVPVVLLGIDYISTTNGDLTLNVPAEGAIAAIASRLMPRDPPMIQGGIQFTGNTGSADVNGASTITADVIKFKDSPASQPTGVHYTGTEDGHPQNFFVRELDLGTNNYLDGGSINGVFVKPKAGVAELLITAPSGSACGINHAATALIAMPNATPVTFQTSGSGRAEFKMNTVAANRAQITTVNGAITLNEGVDLTSNTDLTLQSSFNNIITSGATITGNGSVELSTDPGTSGTGTITIGSVKTSGTTGNEFVTITAGGNLAQTDGTIETSKTINFVSENGSVSLTGDVKTTGTTGSETIKLQTKNDIVQSGGQVSTGGQLVVQSDNGNVGTSAQPINVASPNLTLNSGSPTGNVYAAQLNSTDPVTLGNSPINGSPTSAGGSLQFTTIAPLTLAAGNTISAGKDLNLQAASIQGAGSATSGNGNLILNGTNGNINLGGTAPNSYTSTAGDIIIQLGAVTRPYPNDPSAEYSGAGLTVNPTNSTKVFWGTTPGITVTGTGNRINTPVNNVSFDTKGVSGGITLGDGVVLTAN